MYWFIVNPNSCYGLGAKIWKKLERYLKCSGVSYEVRVTEGVGDARRFAEEITRYGQDAAPVIVVVGGDGTMNETLDGLVFEKTVTLGYIPAGTGNDLRRSLRLPCSPIRGLKRVLNPRRYQYIDYGVLSYGEDARQHRRFAVSCGIGLDAAVSHHLLDVRSRKRRRLMRAHRVSYILSGIRQTFFAHPVKGYLILDGVRKVEFNHIYFISSHIHPFEGGGFKFAPQADYADGKLELCVVHSSSKYQLFPAMIDAWFRHMGHRRGIRFYDCHEVQIHTERPMPVHVDGESCFCQTDIHLRCIERKLRMIV